MAHHGLIKAPRAGTGGNTNFSPMGVHSLYLGSGTTWRHTLQPGLFSLHCRRQSICRQFSEMVLMDLCGQPNLLFVTGKIDHDLGYWELKLFSQCQKIQTELYCTGQSEPLLHCEYWTVTLIYTSKGQNFYFLFSTEPIFCNTVK